MDACEMARPEDPEQLMAQIIDCVEQRDVTGLSTHILERKINEDSIFWDLILKLGDSINSENLQNYPEFFSVCDRCLLYLAQAGNPKEGLLAFLQQMDTFNLDDTKYKSFLKYVKTVLQKIPRKLFHSLDIALETISAYLQTLPLPENLQLEGSEIKLFHLDDKVIRTVDVLNSYLDFLDPLMKSAVVSCQGHGPAKEANVLKKHLLSVFDHPLCHFVLTYNPESDMVKSDSRLCAEKAMDLLTEVETDFHRLLKNSRASDDSDKGKGFVEAGGEPNTSQDAESAVPDVIETWDFQLLVRPHARACIAYLIHTEFLGIDKFPAVYRHEYMLEFHLDVLLFLLQNVNYACNYKGLLLCRSLTARVSKNSIPMHSLDNPGFMDVLNGLIDIMVKCPVRDHRTLAVQVFPALIGNFEAAGRHKIYHTILSSCTHAGLKGHLITLIKNDVSEYLKHCRADVSSTEKDNTAEDLTNGPPEKCFCGNSLHRLLKLTLHLPQAVETDMLENSDQIISALNFLRFLVLADPPNANRTGVWDLMDTIERDFTGPLRLGLDLSLAHYKAERDKLARGERLEVEGPEFSVSVGSETLPAADREQKLDVFARFINTLEMMISLLCRLLDLMEQQKAQL